MIKLSEAQSELNAGTLSSAVSIVTSAVTIVVTVVPTLPDCLYFDHVGYVTCLVFNWTTALLLVCVIYRPTVRPIYILKN